MKKTSIIKALSIAFLSAILFTSCASKKQYGCPGHIVDRIINLF